MSDSEYEDADDVRNEITYVTYKDGKKKKYEHLDFSRFGNLEDIVKIKHEDTFDGYSFNDKHSLDDNIGKCINLEVLIIGEEDYNGSSITSLPESIGNCTKLKNITINWCYDEFSSDSFVLPESIGKLINLEILRLRCTNIKSLPSSLGNCINLKVLDFHCNNLTNLPVSLLNLQRLEDVDFSYNPLDEDEVEDELLQINNIIQK